MAANDDKEESTEKPAKKKGGGKLILIIIILVVLLGAGGAVYFFVLKKAPEAEGGADPAAATAETTAGAQPPRSATVEPGPIQTYPAFLVNLADPGGQRYLKITVSLELSKEKNFPAEVTAKDPKVKDIILSILSSKTYDEINTTQGKIALKQEILRRLNTIMSGGRINDIFITEFVVQ